MMNTILLCRSEAQWLLKESFNTVGSDTSAGAGMQADFENVPRITYGMVALTAIVTG